MILSATPLTILQLCMGNETNRWSRGSSNDLWQGMPTSSTSCFKTQTHSKDQTKSYEHSRATQFLWVIMVAITKKSEEVKGWEVEWWFRSRPWQVSLLRFTQEIPLQGMWPILHSHKHSQQECTEHACDLACERGEGRMPVIFTLFWNQLACVAVGLSVAVWSHLLSWHSERVRVKANIFVMMRSDFWPTSCHNSTKQIAAFC